MPGNCETPMFGWARYQGSQGETPGKCFWDSWMIIPSLIYIYIGGCQPLIYLLGCIYDSLIHSDLGVHFFDITIDDIDIWAFGSYWSHDQPHELDSGVPYGPCFIDIIDTSWGMVRNLNHTRMKGGTTVPHSFKHVRCCEKIYYCVAQCIGPN